MSSAIVSRYYERIGNGSLSQFLLVPPENDCVLGRGCVTQYDCHYTYSGEVIGIFARGENYYCNLYYEIHEYQIDIGTHLCGSLCVVRRIDRKIIEWDRFVSFMEKLLERNDHMKFCHPAVSIPYHFVQACLHVLDHFLDKKHAVKTIVKFVNEYQRLDLSCEKEEWGHNDDELKYCRSVMEELSIIFESFAKSNSFSYDSKSCNTYLVVDFLRVFCTMFNGSLLFSRVLGLKHCYQWAKSFRDISKSQG